MKKLQDIYKKRNLFVHSSFRRYRKKLASFMSTKNPKGFSAKRRHFSFVSHRIVTNSYCKLEINELQKVAGLNFPLWVDNREIRDWRTITDFDWMSSQYILLLSESYRTS